MLIKYDEDENRAEFVTWFGKKMQMTIMHEM